MDNPFSKTPSKDAKKIFQIALSAVINRLLDAAEFLQPKDGEAPPPRLEPVIILSSSGNLPQLADSNKNLTTVWSALHSTKELRERTVVLLDIADLRERHGLAVSSELSWERTAQETVVEFRRSKHLRRLLDFGQIIVRFGVTGALHIIRRGIADWSYRLYFDPSKDDRSWNDAHADGEVLGYSGLFAASLVEDLTQICMSRSNEPMLPDLPHSIGEAIPKAIVRCQLLTKDGYGESSRINDIRKDHKTVFVGVLQPERLSQKDTPPISRIDVPQLLLRNWSIVSQSAQVRLGSVARNIVLFGADVALNRQAPDNAAIIRACVQQVRESASELWKKVFDDGIAIPTPEQIEKRLVDDVQTTVRDWMPGKWPLHSDSHKDKLLKLQDVPWKGIAQSIRGALSNIKKKAKKLDCTKHSQLRETVIVPGLDKLAEDIGEMLAEVFCLPPSSDLVYEPVAAPLVRFGDQYTVVDRREIEGVRSIKKLIKDHLDQIHADKERPTKEKHARPLSLSIFGPPGSGKSTAVRSILEGLKDHPTKTKSLPPFNLAQFTREKDLSTAFDNVVEASAQEEVPIAFFDEFDCRLNDEPFGWLKFFLSPMEDGKYRGKPVNNAILVFAGGTSSTFAEFSLENRPRTDQQFQLFSFAKGPDFVSRLHGHLNIVGINPADPDDELYLIRRAIVVRDMLAKIQELKPGEEARIDRDMLRALLLVPKYLHGARSLRMLLELCSRSERRTVSKSSLPLLQQLNMQVEGKAFLDLINNVSADMSGEWDVPLLTG